jgi:hypothetical protein
MPPLPNNEESTEQKQGVKQPEASAPASLDGWLIFFKEKKKSDIDDVSIFKFEEFILNYKAGYANLSPAIKSAVDDIDVKISALSFRIKRDIELRASPKFFEILDEMKTSLVILETLLKTGKK